MDKITIYLDSLSSEDIYFKMAVNDYLNNDAYKDYPISYKELESDGRYVYVEITYKDSFSLFEIVRSLGYKSKSNSL